MELTLLPRGSYLAAQFRLNCRNPRLSPAQKQYCQTPVGSLELSTLQFYAQIVGLEYRGVPRVTLEAELLRVYLTQGLLLTHNVYTDDYVEVPDLMQCDQECEMELESDTAECYSSDWY